MMNRLGYLILLSVFTLQFCGLLKTNNTYDPLPAPSASAAPAPSPIYVDIEIHQWAELANQGDLSSYNGYGAYTFVITNRGESFPETWGKYTYLLSLIRGVSGVTASGLEHNDQWYSDSLENIHLFLLPTSGSLSTSLSQRIRAQLPDNLKGNLEGPGPFLVTVFDQRLHGPQIQTALIANLSRINRNAFPDLVREYEGFLRNETEYVGVEKFERFRINVISHISDLAGYFTIAQAAAAELYPFSPTINKPNNIGIN